jgi:hypothetical protein
MFNLSKIRVYLFIKSNYNYVITATFAYLFQVFSFPFYTVKTIVAPEQQFGKPGCVGKKIKLAP